MRRIVPLIAGFAILGCLCLMRYGLVPAAIMRLCGHEVVADREVDAVPVENKAASDELVGHIRVTNCSDSEVTLIGGSSECDCMMPNDLPRKIPPYETVTIDIKVMPEPGPAYFHHVELITNSKADPKLSSAVWVNRK